MTTIMFRFYNGVLYLFLCILAAQHPALAQESLDINITYLVREEEPRVPLSLLDPVEQINGYSGALLGLKDNQTTGSFLNQHYELNDFTLAADEAISEVAARLSEQDQPLIIADLNADDLLVLADALPSALILNIRSKDNVLRNANCRGNVLHISPSRAMLADALAQYLAWKRWSKVVLVTGRHAVDQAYGNALKRAAGRFGLKLIEEKQWDSIPGARRTDSGHHSAQQEIPEFTQFKKHDILLVADENDEFGEYLSYRSTKPRPVAGTQGLVPTAWHRTQEQWGATQIQRRFEKIAGRSMGERDYAAWSAMRTLGEAITQIRSFKASDVKAFVLSDKFKLAAFKGVPLTFRQWNGQLRQPVLLVAPRMLVSVSPQRGFLHEHSQLDTLGFDRPESTCTAF